MSDSSLTLRPDAVVSDNLRAYSQGPVLNGDATQGLRARVWRARADNLTSTIFLSRANDANDAWEAEVALFTYVGTASEIDLAFEQNARPVVCIEITGNIHLYWFDPNLGDFVLVNFDTGRNPRLILDNPDHPDDSDVLLFYIRDLSDALVYRVQRERYQTRHDTPLTGISNTFLEEVFRTTDWRVACIVSIRNTVTGRYSLGRLETTMYPVPVGPDGIDMLFTIRDSLLVVVVLVPDLEVEALNAVFSMRNSLLVEPLILHTLFDIDELEAIFSMRDSELETVVVEHTLFDVDELSAVFSMRTSLLVAIVIEHELFDKDALTANFTMRPGTLVNA